DSGVVISNSPDSVITDCTFYNNPAAGIYLEGSAHCSISNCDAFNNGLTGFWICCISDETSMINCHSYNNFIGVSIQKTAYVTLRNNIIHDNVYDLDIDSRYSSGYLMDFIHDIDTSNTINGKPIYYLIEQDNLVFDNIDTISFLAFVSCDNITSDFDEII
ncbi:unnamed protein product, partial [marine sediment metagenome]